MEMEMTTKTKMKKKKSSPTTTKGKRNRTCPSCFCMLDPICYGWHIKKCAFFSSSSSSGDDDKKKICEENPELFLSVGNEEETTEEKPHPGSISHIKTAMASQSVANNEEEIMDPERSLYMKAENEHELSQKLKEKMQENQPESILCVKGLKSTENGAFSQKMKDLEEKLCKDSESFLYVQHLISTISALKEENDALSQKVKNMEENLRCHSERFLCVHALKSTISDLSPENEALSQKLKSLEKNPHIDLENVLHKQGLKDAISDFGVENDQLSQKKKYSEENAGLKSTISALKAENEDHAENNVFQKDDHAEADDFHEGDHGISAVGALQHGKEKPPCSQSHNVHMCLNEEEIVLNDEKGKLLNQGQEVKDDRAVNSAKSSQHGVEKPQFGHLCDLVTMHEYSNKGERVIKGEKEKLVGQSQEEKNDSGIILQYGTERSQCSQSQDLVNLQEYSRQQERVLNGEQEKLVDQSQEEKVDFLKDDNVEKKEELDLDRIVSLACGEEAYLHDFLVEVDARVKSGKQGDVDTPLLLDNHESVLFGYVSPVKAGGATDTRMQSRKPPESEVMFPSLSESSTSSLCADKAKTHSRRRVMFISESESENESIHKKPSGIESPIREFTSKANELSDIGNQHNKFGTVFTAFKRALDIDLESKESSYLCALRRNNKIEALQDRALKGNCTPNWSSNASEHNSEIDGYELSSAQRRKRLRTLSILSTQKDSKTEASLALNKEEEGSSRHGKAFINVLGISSRTRKRLFEDKSSNEDANESVTSSSLDGFIVSSDDEGMKSSDGSDSTSRTWLSENNDQTHNMKRMRDLKMRNHAWDYEAEMLSVLDTDDELCLRAVCALNRRQTEDEQHEKISKYLNKRGFNSSHAARASRYAEFLTDGNPSGPVKKSVKNLAKYDPSALKYCRMLTFIYSKQLFDMYIHDDDPYFPC